MGRFLRRSVNPELEREVLRIRLELEKQLGITDPRMLSRPKIQRIIVEKSKRMTGKLSETDIMRILGR